MNVCVCVCERERERESVPNDTGYLDWCTYVLPQDIKLCACVFVCMYVCVCVCACVCV